VRLLTYRPGPPLSRLVELLWIYESSGEAHAAERLLPDGTAELVIDLRDTVERGVLMGPHSAPCEIGTAEPTAVMGAHFRPGGAFPFLKQPASELHCLVVPPEDVWRARARDLREQLLENTVAADRFGIFERFLLEQASRPLALHPAVTFALSEFGTARGAVPVGQVTARIGLSERRFIELFREQVGLTPKLYCRLTRFQHALRRLERGEIKLARLALDCGYHDQAHFNHDFRTFSGASPSAFLARWAGRPNHLPA
jgi:AraC-like DNA-binding protein